MAEESVAAVADALEDSPVLEAVLGDALPKLRMFHVKLQQEGELRGIIGPRDVGILWERHILNSAAIVPFVREATAGAGRKTVADIGSGGGFPGLVAAVCLPDHSFTLIEPMERRVEWLDECIELMGLDNVRIIRARAEEAIAALKPVRNRRGGKRNNGGRARAMRSGAVHEGMTRTMHGGQDGEVSIPASVSSNPIASDDMRHSQEATGSSTAAHGTLRHVVPVDALRHEEPFTVVTCRAVAPMTKLSGWTMPLIRSHGRLVALKGRSAQAEIEKAAKEIAKTGGVNPRVLEAAVGPDLEPTHVVVVDKR